MNSLEPEACLILRDERKRLAASVAHLTWFRRFFKLTKEIESNPEWTVDLTEDEKPSGEFVKLRHEATRGFTYWSDYWWLHGGLRGRAPGDYLLPSRITGQDPRDEKTQFPRRQDFVFVTRQHPYANKYACLLLDGVIYEVATEGRVRPEPSHLRALMILYEDPSLNHVPRQHLIELVEGFTCERAQVVHVRERRKDWYEDDKAGRPRRRV